MVYYSLADNHINLSHQDDDCEDIPLINLLSTPFLENGSKSKNVKLAVVDRYSKTVNTYLVTHFDLNRDSTIILTPMNILPATVLLI